MECNQPCTKEEIISELHNWVGGDPESAFDHAVKNGLVKKTGKTRLRRDLWILDNP